MIAGKPLLISEEKEVKYFVSSKYGCCTKDEEGLHYYWSKTQNYNIYFLSNVLQFPYCVSIYFSSNKKIGIHYPVHRSGFSDPI